MGGRGGAKGARTGAGQEGGVIAQFFTIKPCNLHKQPPILCLFLLSFGVITTAAALLSHCFRFDVQVE